MNRRTGWIVAILAVVVVGAVLALLLLGGGEQEVGEQRQEEISLRAGNFFFTPKSLTAKVGEEMSLNIQVDGAHTFTIDELGVDVPLRSDRRTVTFTPERAGTFTYYCAIPGHREAGMVGTLTVES